MQFPSLTTNVLIGASPDTHVAQADLFPAYLRRQSESSDDAKRREKKELDEQIQRNADKRKNELQQTRLQLIADSRSVQDRRDQLDAIDDRRVLRRAELDHKELDAKLDRRLDHKHRDFAEYRIKGVVDGDSAERPEESLNMIGLSRQAAKDSENFKPENVTEIQGTPKTVLHPSQEVVPQNTVTRNDVSAIERGNAENRLKGGNEVSSSKGTEPIKTDAVETGKQMQMLASFSELSAKLASALKQPNADGATRGNARPVFTNLRESTPPPYSDDGVELDSIPLEKKPRKPTPEFFEALDAAFGSKSRKKSEHLENGKNHFQAQLSQAESQHGSAAKKANQLDRPMLDQMDRVRLVQRVANACLFAANQSGTIRIKLHPESLGSVAVKIRTKNKAMNIELETETEAARSLLLENVDDLKKQLQTHGMRVESFSVQVAS